MRASRRGFLSGGPTTPSLTARPRGTSARQSLVAPDQSAGPATREPSPARQHLVTGRSGLAPGGLPPAPRKALSARLTRRLLGSADRGIRGPAVGPVVGGNGEPLTDPRASPRPRGLHVTRGPDSRSGPEGAGIRSAQDRQSTGRTLAPFAARAAEYSRGPSRASSLLCPGHGITPAAPSGLLLARAAGPLLRPQPGLPWSVPSGPPIGPLPPKARHWPGPGARCRLWPGRPSDQSLGHGPGSACRATTS